MPTKQATPPHDTYWRLSLAYGFDTIIGIGESYEVDPECGCCEKVRVRFADDSSMLISPHSLFPATVAQVKAVFGAKRAQVWQDIIEGRSRPESKPAPAGLNPEVNQPSLFC